MNRLTSLGREPARLLFGLAEAADALITQGWPVEVRRRHDTFTIEVDPAGAPVTDDDRAFEELVPFTTTGTDPPGVATPN